MKTCPKHGIEYEGWCGACDTAYEYNYNTDLLRSFEQGTNGQPHTYMTQSIEHQAAYIRGQKFAKKPKKEVTDMDLVRVYHYIRNEGHNMDQCLLELKKLIKKAKEK